MMVCLHDSYLVFLLLYDELLEILSHSRSVLLSMEYVWAWIIEMVLLFEGYLHLTGTYNQGGSVACGNGTSICMDTYTPKFMVLAC